MLPLIAVVIFLITPLIMLLIQLARPRFAFHWLAAALATLLALPMLLFSRPTAPLLLARLDWQPDSFFHASPALLLDDISWAYASAIAALTLAAMFTFVARRQEPNWRAWAGGLALAGLGILAALAGNLLTLLLAWAALDITELIILLLQLHESAARERAVVAFSARGGGLALALAAWMMAWATGASVEFATLSPRLSLALLLAAALRLGVLPLHLPLRADAALRRGLGTLLRLIPAAASLPLLSRVAVAGAPAELQTALLALTVFAALYGATNFAAAPDELSGRPYWLIAIAALSVSAAARGLPAASLSWGLAGLLAGGVLFLYSFRRRILMILLAIGWLGVAGLPFTPGWDGAQAATPWFLPALALLLLGYSRHALRPVEAGAPWERWVWTVYPLGLTVPLAVQWWIVGPGFTGRSMASVQSLSGWGGAIGAGLAALLWLAGWVRRAPLQAARRSARWRDLASRVFSLEWLYQLVWQVYRFLGRFITSLSLILEGEGGVLWGLVLLALLASLFFGGSGGGGG